MAGNNSEKPKRKQRGPGTPWKPGQSGNPRGRPKGIEGLAKYLRVKLRNGRVGADSLMAIGQGTETRVRHVVTKVGIQQVEEPPSFAESIAAWKVLFDRMHGTAQKFVEITGAGGGPLSFSLESLKNLSDEDLEQMEGILERASGDDTDSAGGSEGGEGAEGGGAPEE
jgi:hypothetical protein